jgi:hypothetical protein
MLVYAINSGMLILSMISVAYRGLYERVFADGIRSEFRTCG